MTWLRECPDLEPLLYSLLTFLLFSYEGAKLSGLLGGALSVQMIQRAGHQTIKAHGHSVMSREYRPLAQTCLTGSSFFCVY